MQQGIRNRCGGLIAVLMASTDGLLTRRKRCGALGRIRTRLVTGMRAIGQTRIPLRPWATPPDVEKKQTRIITWEQEQTRTSETCGAIEPQWIPVSDHRDPVGPR